MIARWLHAWVCVAGLVALGSVSCKPAGSMRSPGVDADKAAPTQPPAPPQGPRDYEESEGTAPAVDRDADDHRSLNVRSKETQADERQGLSSLQAQLRTAEAQFQEAAAMPVATTDRCSRICSLSDNICELGAQICSLAEANPKKRRYQRACENAQDACGNAQVSCQRCG
ncbi:MAG: hypothetical protein K0V04_23000 [Deltaproteobacteria bacterium]|nr:hypothetical protein [Deltaproteobacteria bacterium]